MESVTGGGVSQETRYVRARNAVRRMLESYHDQTLGCDSYRIVWERQGEVLPELSCYLKADIGNEPKPDGKHARGMTEDVSYRELLTRLSTELAMAEAAYLLRSWVN
jgi:hypothetical protein